tara:strand:- start:1455 stop:1928 length:474 start_codon:yes stop_codon:yes gene_type:complete
MRCPFCGHEATAVKDSRVANENTAIRRRRQCMECGGRFTTVEHIQLLSLKVVKKDGTLEPFQREKLEHAFAKALHKRPVKEDRIDKVINSLVRQLESRGEMEISSTDIGEKVMDALKNLDAVAYIRFASVYRDFSKPNDFEDFIRQATSSREENTES